MSELTDVKITLAGPNADNILLAKVSGLPAQITSEIEAIDALYLELSGKQSLLGYQNRRLVFSIGGYWSSQDRFVAGSYESNTFQWTTFGGINCLVESISV